MMDISGAIFDVDGTLLDSMDPWLHLGTDFMREMGVEPIATLDEEMLRMSLEESAQRIRELGVQLSAEKIHAALNERMDNFYKYRAPLRPGVADFLLALADNGIPMCVATATDIAQVEAALLRTGIRPYFKEIITCTQLHTTKHVPDIYEAARHVIGTPLESTWVFEDARHAAETAARAGFRVCGVCDPSEPDQEVLRSISDIYITSFEDARRVFGLKK